VACSVGRYVAFTGKKYGLLVASSQRDDAALPATPVDQYVTFSYEDKAAPTGGSVSYFVASSQGRCLSGCFVDNFVGSLSATYVESYVTLWGRQV
jgi:hypothetical protein